MDFRAAPWGRQAYNPFWYSHVSASKHPHLGFPFAKGAVLALFQPISANAANGKRPAFRLRQVQRAAGQKASEQVQEAGRSR